MGELEIRTGGVVAVDTASLVAAAGRLEALGCDLDEVSGLFRRAVSRVGALPGAEGIGALARAEYLAHRSSEFASETRAIGDRLGDLAAVFETVELRAERAAAEAAGDTRGVARIDARLDVIGAEHPWTGLRATWDGLWRAATWSDAFVGHAGTVGSWGAIGGGTVAGMAIWGMAGAGRLVGAGTIERDARLTGPAQAVHVRALPAASGGVGTASAPTSLADAAARIPAGETSRVRVERYTMPDGSRQFAVYVRGTTSDGDADPFDMESNGQLYRGERSASYDAALAALHDAGAQPGDAVHAFGHSQGAMVASRLALEGGFDTQTLVTFGSPVEADVGAETLSVVVRHTDDPVTFLAGGGHDAGVGAPGSLVAERAVDPTVSTRDADPFAAHHLVTYEETAAMLDGSEDPRLDAVRDRLSQLGAAASVDVTEYAADIVSPPSSADEG